MIYMMLRIQGIIPKGLYDSSYNLRLVKYHCSAGWLLRYSFRTQGKYCLWCRFSWWFLLAVYSEKTTYPTPITRDWKRYQPPAVNIWWDLLIIIYDLSLCLLITIIANPIITSWINKFHGRSHLNCRLLSCTIWLNGCWIWRAQAANAMGYGGVRSHAGILNSWMVYFMENHIWKRMYVIGVPQVTLWLMKPRYIHEFFVSLRDQEMEEAMIIW